jgi:hypothetical protein
VACRRCGALCVPGRLAVFVGCPLAAGGEHEGGTDQDAGDDRPLDMPAQLAGVACSRHAPDPDPPARLDGQEGVEGAVAMADDESIDVLVHPSCAPTVEGFDGVAAAREAIIEGRRGVSER